MVPELLTGEEETVYGDSGYLGAEKREGALIKPHLNAKMSLRSDMMPFSCQYWNQKP